MYIHKQNLQGWLDDLKDQADCLYRDARLNSGLIKDQMHSEAEGIESAVYYIRRKIKESCIRGQT